MNNMKMREENEFISLLRRITNNYMPTSVLVSFANQVEENKNLTLQYRKDAEFYKNITATNFNKTTDAKNLAEDYAQDALDSKNSAAGSATTATIAASSASGAKIAAEAAQTAAEAARDGAAASAASIDTDTGQWLVVTDNIVNVSYRSTFVGSYIKIKDRVIAIANGVAYANDPNTESIFEIRDFPIPAESTTNNLGDVVGTVTGIATNGETITGYIEQSDDGNKGRVKFISTSTTAMIKLSITLMYRIGDTD
jgi:hypothetical protein